MSLMSSAPPRSAGGERSGAPAAIRSTRAVFLVLGIVTAAWAPLVPDLKLRLALDDAELGLMLLCIGGGSLLAAPVTGLVVARVGCRAVMLGLGVVFCATLPAMTVMPGVALTAVALAVFGATIAGIDVAMNIQAVAVERAAGRPMMSGFHGLFSLGGLGGASLVSVLLALGAVPLAAAMGVALGGGRGVADAGAGDAGAGGGAGGGDGGAAWAARADRGVVFHRLHGRGRGA